jgi:hypothetical protein
MCRASFFISGRVAVLFSPGLVGMLLNACTELSEPDRNREVAGTTFESTFEIEDRITLEETSEVVNVGIRVTPDPKGGYLVADGREAQVRRYSEDGRLLWYAGRRGDGPGEFQAPTGAVRLPSGDVVVVDRNGRLTILGSSGGEVLRTVPTGIRALDGVWVLGPGELLLSGFHPDGPMEPRLHVWSLSEEEITWSFFSPLLTTPNRDISVVVGWSRAALRGDTILVTFTTMDTLFFYSREGMLQRKIPLPSTYLRRVEADDQPPSALAPAERIAALARFDYVGELQITEAGHLLVEYRSLSGDETGIEWNRWHLLGVDRNGQALFEIRDGPRLLSVAGPGDRVIFQDPEPGLPSNWLIARRGSEVLDDSPRSRDQVDQGGSFPGGDRQAQRSILRAADSDSVLQIGQLVRIRFDADDSPEEILGFIGRIATCWAAFYFDPPADGRSGIVPVDWEANRYRSAEVFVTVDSVYGSRGSDRPDPEQVLVGQDWIELGQDFVQEHFTGCW